MQRRGEGGAMGRATKEQQLLGCAAGTVALWAIICLLAFLAWVLPGSASQPGWTVSPVAMVYEILLEVAFLASPVVGAIAVAVAASHRDWIPALCLVTITGLGILSVGILLPIGGQTWNALVEEVFVGGTLASGHSVLW